MVILLNGAFGVGKTTVAQRLIARLPESALYDPERIGWVLRRLPRALPLRGRGTDDFQDVDLWRRLTIVFGRIGLRLRPILVVPMAFSNRAYLEEIRAGLAAADSAVLHFCLTAKFEVIESRLRGRGAESWCFRRAAECCEAHADPFFAEQIATDGRTPDEIADTIADRVRTLSAQASPVETGTSSASPHSAHDPS